MDYNLHKVCRVCLEEGALTSIYNTDFAMAPYTMMMIVAKIKIYKSDGLPAVICNNCIYRLGVAYHFKQECENSDARLRQYLGLPDRDYGISDAETNTEFTNQLTNKSLSYVEENSDDETDANILIPKKNKRSSRYQRKPPEDHKKRGPKPLPKMPHSCYECQKSFKCVAQLQTHMRTHTGEKPFGCSYCPRRFAQKYNLHIHERTHTGYRPFQCEICSKQFSALGNFQAHQKIHLGERNHVCAVCQKGFYSAGDLTKHMVTHTGLKNHHCDVCGKTFSRQRDMRAHKRKMHSIQERSEEDDDDDTAVDAVNVVGTGTVPPYAFRCPECDKEFTSAENVSVHFRTHSSNNLLNVPFGSGQIQMPPPPPPPPPPATHYTHHHHYDPLHHTHPATHPHHLQLNPVATLQTNPAGSMAMLMHQPAMHAAQRLHPY